MAADDMPALRDKLDALHFPTRSLPREVTDDRSMCDDYPPLPPIKSKDTRSEVFVHRSLIGRPASLFEDPAEDDTDIILPDNERLEHIGDAVVNLCATMLIREKYPRLRVGPASKLRALVVGNAALAKHAAHYGLQNRLIVSHAQAAQLKRSQAVLGDLFEAYVGGLFKENNYSLPPVYDWLRKVFEPFVEEGYRSVREEHMVTAGGPPPAESEIADSDATPSHGSGSNKYSSSDADSAFSFTSSDIMYGSSVSAATPSFTHGGSSTWTGSPPDTPTASRLPLPTPNVLPATPPAMRTSNLPTVYSPSPNPSPSRFMNPTPVVRAESGHLSYLNQWLSQQRRKPVQWKETQRGGNPTTPLWYVEGWVENESGQLDLIGSASAPTKRAARNDVAAQAFQHFNIR